MQKFLLILILVTTSACSSAFQEKGLAGLQENSLAYVYYVEGYGPPLTGAGKVIAIGLKQGFEGVILIKKDGEIAIDHYLPYKEIIEKLRRKQRENAMPFARSTIP